MPSWKKYKNIILIVIVFCLAWAGPGLIKNKDGSVYRLDTKEKVIALTFDDGPRHGSCEELLDLLKAEDIQATFFVVGGSANTFPDLLYRIYREGHDIGNHSYNHIALDLNDKAKIKDQLQKNREIIKKITGQTPKIFRAPGGQYNNNTYQAAKELGLQVVNWSVNAADYNMETPYFERGEALFIKSAELIEADVLAQIKAGDIILLHNGTYETVAALKKLIPRLKNEGYKFVKLNNYL